MSSLKLLRLASVALLAASLSAGAQGCDTQPPDADEAYNRYQLLTASSDDGNATEIAAGTIALINGAESRVWIAVTELEHADVASALLEASSRGVDVRVVADADRRSSSGLQMLEDAGFRVLNDEAEAGAIGNATLPAPNIIRYADGATIHSPEPGNDIFRDGDENLMSHNFVVIDDTTVVNLTGGFGDGSSDGRIRTGFVASSQDLNKDFTDEFAQLASGVDATTPSAYNGPVKAIADGRQLYPGTIADFELYFGPQERTAKRIVDDVFGARSSLWIATESLTNEFVCRAILFKLRTAFDVRIVLGEPVDATQTTRGSTCNTLAEQFDGNPVREGTTQELRILPELATNLTVLDALPSPSEMEGRQMAMVHSQPLLASLTFRAAATDGAPDEALAADAFADSNLWIVRQFTGHEEPAYASLVDQFNTIWEAAE